MTHIYLCYDPSISCFIGRVTPNYWFTHREEANSFAHKYNVAYPHLKRLKVEVKFLAWGPHKPNPNNNIIMAWYDGKVSFFRAWSPSNLRDLNASRLPWKILIPYKTNK